ncbi:hypothetical protein BCR36DRAFT_588393 [Piromyces finnis]|uniref:Uncharacterized protein n=1 Tax=Piromyces finnis TaxID=1754191 RepID=A0A1Y1UHF8_9FUNG|nr:hypothetical protein BCR36DRAFT_588393 [Piromyces finnis]|eukprot:ORX37488.1 hypothetical protein BCR36DRAFT_588393 [Piromyces finnis]
MDLGSNSNYVLVIIILNRTSPESVRLDLPLRNNDKGIHSIQLFTPLIHKTTMSKFHTVVKVGNEVIVWKTWFGNEATQFNLKTLRIDNCQIQNFSEYNKNTKRVSLIIQQDIIDIKTCVTASACLLSSYTIESNQNNNFIALSESGDIYTWKLIPKREKLKQKSSISNIAVNIGRAAIPVKLHNFEFKKLSSDELMLDEFIIYVVEYFFDAEQEARKNNNNSSNILTEKKKKKNAKGKDSDIAMVKYSKLDIFSPESTRKNAWEITSLLIWILKKLFQIVSASPKNTTTWNTSSLTSNANSQSIPNKNNNDNNNSNNKKLIEKSENNNNFYHLKNNEARTKNFQKLSQKERIKASKLLAAETRSQLRR